jgi:hypothetical protein
MTKTENGVSIMQKEGINMTKTENGVSIMQKESLSPID